MRLEAYTCYLNHHPDEKAQTIVNDHRRKKLATYASHGQHGIDQKRRTKARTGTSRSHILKKQITVEPVAERMEPGKPQGHQLRDKPGILSDCCPWSRRDFEPGDRNTIIMPIRQRRFGLIRMLDAIRIPVAIARGTIVIMPIIMILPIPKHLRTLLIAIRLLCAQRPVLVIEVEFQFGEGCIAADEAEELEDRPVATIPDVSHQIIQELFAIFESLEFALDTAPATLVAGPVDDAFEAVFGAVLAGRFPGTLSS